MNPFPIGAPIILTQDFLTTTAQTQPILTTIPQNSVLPPNGQSNYLQIFTPFQTIEQMGGLLTNETQFFEYSNPTGKSSFVIFELMTSYCCCCCFFYFHSAFPILTSAGNRYSDV